jgi:hypothetical protein
MDALWPGSMAENREREKLGDGRGTRTLKSTGEEAGGRKDRRSEDRREVCRGGRENVHQRVGALPEESLAERPDCNASCDRAGRHAPP